MDYLQLFWESLHAFSDAQLDKDEVFLGGCPPEALALHRPGFVCSFQRHLGHMVGVGRSRLDRLEWFFLSREGLPEFGGGNLMKAKRNQMSSLPVKLICRYIEEES